MSNLDISAILERIEKLERQINDQKNNVSTATWSVPEYSISNVPTNGSVKIAVLTGLSSSPNTMLCFWYSGTWYRSDTGGAAN